MHILHRCFGYQQHLAKMINLKSQSGNFTIYNDSLLVLHSRTNCVSVH